MARNRRRHKDPSHLHALWVIFLIYAVPPYAWHNMWIHRKYHTWFPGVAWINVAWVAIPSIIYLVFVYPQLIANNKIPLLPVQFIIFIIAYTLMQIPYGLFLKIEISQNKSFPKRLLLPTMIIFSIDFIFTLIIVPMAIPFFNNPVYNLLIWILNK